MMTTKQAGELRDRALLLAQGVDSNYFELGEILFKLQSLTVKHLDETYFVHELWGYPTPYDWAEVDLGIHVRPARHLARIYERFAVDLEGKWDKTQLLSRTKMRALLKVVKPRTTKAGVAKWVDYARGVSCCQLEHHIEETLYGITAHKKNFSVQLTPEQRTSLDKAINTVFEEANVRTTGDAVELIVNDWLQQHKAVEKLKKLKKAG